jgi:DDE superfamily endonuclease
VNTSTANPPTPTPAGHGREDSADHVASTEVLPARTLADLDTFRRKLMGCLTHRGDALFELADAMACTPGRVYSPAELSLEPEFRRGHGSVYAGLNHGHIDHTALRRLLVEQLAPARPGEPLMVAIDTTPLARPDATFADNRTMVQVRGKGGDVFLPGWSYSVMVGICWGSSSWVDPLEARRVKPTDNHTELTIDQIRDLLADLAATGKLAPHAPPPLVLLDAGNDPTALTYELLYKPDGTRVQLLTRLSGKRVFYTDAPERAPGQRGAPRRHGRKLSLSNPGSGPPPDTALTTQSPRYGTVRVQTWANMHQQLHRDGHWTTWPPDTELPIVRGTVIRVSVEHLPGGRKPLKDIWLFHTAPPGTEPDIDLLWKAYLRRFDQEHFHRFGKVHLGLRSAHLSSAAATDRWVQLALAVYAQLRIASTLTDEIRRPWHPKPTPGSVASPYQTRLGFRRLRAQLGTPAKPAKFTRPGPGRPKGSKNRPKAPCPPHRKSVKTDSSQECQR